MTTARASGVNIALTRSRPMLFAGLALALVVLLLVMLASVAFGTAAIDLPTAWAALTSYDGSTEHLIIRTLRAPRALIASAVGASLAVSGALMQGLTRNPLASPGLLGINAGAALAVVAAVSLLDIASLSLFAWFAFAGAAVAALLVYGLGAIGPGGSTPLKLTLAGAAIMWFCSSLTTALLIINEGTLDEVRFWLAGSIADRDMQMFLQLAPYMGVGLFGALAIGKHMTTLSLGDEVAQGLGLRIEWVKLAAVLIVVLLAGSAVAAAGPIAFVGLIIPHIVRFFVGQDYRWLLPYSALWGATFLVLADVGARLVIRPQEAPVGVMTALIGAPFFVFLIRWRVRR